MLTDEDIEKLQSIIRGDSTAAVGYCLAAVRAYTAHSTGEVASFFDTEPETVIALGSFIPQTVASICSCSCIRAC